MKIKSLFFVFLLLATSLVCFAQVDSTGLDGVFGKKGMVQGSVYKITFQRSDLKVTVNDFSVAPGLALSSWIGIMVMGK